MPTVASVEPLRIHNYLGIIPVAFVIRSMNLVCSTSLVFVQQTTALLFHHVNAEYKLILSAYKDLFRVLAVGRVKNEFLNKLNLE